MYLGLDVPRGVSVPPVTTWGTSNSPKVVLTWFHSLHAGAEKQLRYSTKLRALTSAGHWRKGNEYSFFWRCAEVNLSNVT